MNVRGPISPVFLIEPSETIRRVFAYDPTEMLKRAPLVDFYKRNNYIGMEHLFLQPDTSLCACGCGVALPKRRSRWASDVCRNYAVTVYFVFRGDTDVIRRLMQHYLPHECVTCHCEDYTIEKTKMVTWGGRDPFETTTYSATGLHVEHILAVKDGGGCCWLGNFQFMCHRCHGQKTATEKQLRNKMPAISPSTLF